MDTQTVTPSTFDSKRIGDHAYFDPLQSMFIEASAGTGKTYTIQQIVARLINDGTKLSQILLVTFTEKAAGELKDRIRAKIEEVLENKHLVKDVGEELCKDKIELFENALRELDSAQIFTIHSFCQKTLKTYAYDAGRPFDMQLVDDALVKNIIQRKLRDEWPNNPEFKALLGYAETEDNDNNTDDAGNELEKLVKDLEELLVSAITKYYLDKDGNERIISLSTRDETLKEYATIANYNDLTKFNDFNHIIDILNDHRAYKLSKPSNKDGKRTIPATIELIKNWKSPEKLISGYPKAYKSEWNWPEELIDAYQKLNNLRDILDRTRDAKSIFLRCFLCHQLPDLYKEWRQEKLNHKCESYQDMITAVHQAVVLDEDSKLRDELRKAYTYAIIDEFQDTNRLQWDIFRTLFFNVPNHAIYVVGDPKQSIYAFQGADLTVYQEAIRTIGNGRRLDTNYRSTSELIAACNHLFDADSEFFNDGNLVFSESKSPDNKASTHFDGAPTPPVWLSAEEISESDFAKLAAQKIVECCTKTDTGQTGLQIFDKNKPDTLRNVSFRDFAILARTRKEFPFIETELQNLGIPYVRYKDDNLFNSRECMQWIALFKAIDADDFTAYNRRILNEALLTDFFDPLIVSERIECGLSNRLIKTVCPKLHTVNLDIYDDPQRRERQQLAKYHALARKFRWAEMLECIYQESDIETRTANDLSKLQALAKFQQIGNYSIEYLYANRCTLQELVKHLDNLQKKADETTDKDGNLVARGTDFDAVQLMTIHASKGLEFPIVIGVGGFKEYNDQAKGPYTYHEIVDDRYHKYLGFDNESKIKQKDEDIKEWKRLFYVAYTRASALLILPRYIKTCDDFLKNSINTFVNNLELFLDLKDTEESTETADPSNPTLQDKLKVLVHDILNTSDITEVSNDYFSIKEQKTHIQALQNSLGKKSLIQHSYSTLASKVQLKKVEITPDTPDCSTPCPECAPDDADFDLAEPEIHDANGKCADIASDGTDADTPRYILEPNVDLTPKPIAHKPDYDTAYPPISDTNYPRGKQLGNAIHEVFENLDFAKAQARLEDFQTDPEVKALIEQTYAKYGLPLSKHSEWHAITAQFVWRTLNAKLPVIEGACDAQDAFALKDLPENSHRAEVEFYLEGALIHNDDMPKTGEYYSKGFIDLLFMREVNGTKRYSILDWKSDRMESGEYANPDALKAKVDREYAVQRVLYSYCLIQWLKQFYPNLKPDEIFDQHFGGIYYAFVRGTANGTANGIYAQTWDSYQTLKNNYKEIHKLMFAPSQKENPNND